jgi:hypothetical protein
LLHTVGGFAHELPFEVRLIRELPRFLEDCLLSTGRIGAEGIHHLVAFEPRGVVEEVDRHVDRRKNPLDLLLAGVPEPEPLGNEPRLAFDHEVAACLDRLSPYTPLEYLITAFEVPFTACQTLEGRQGVAGRLTGLGIL